MIKPQLTINREDAKKQVHTFIEEGKIKLTQYKMFDEYFADQYSHVGSLISTDASIDEGLRKINNDFSDWHSRVYEFLLSAFEPCGLAKAFYLAYCYSFK